MFWEGQLLTGTRVEECTGGARATREEETTGEVDTTKDAEITREA